MTGLPSTTPGRLLDRLKELLLLRNDTELAIALQTTPGLISKVRHGKLPVSDWLLISMHEESELSIRELRALNGLGCQ
jgi:hypothetical protein